MPIQVFNHDEWCGIVDDMFGRLNVVLNGLTALGKNFSKDQIIY